MIDQLDLFPAGPRPLSSYTIMEWDSTAFKEARVAWNQATPAEREIWNCSLKFPHWPLCGVWEFQGELAFFKEDKN